MNTTATGRAAEQLASEHLEAAGFRILSRNWRNRWCEIDIVARRGAQIHIVEVKYRRSTAYGLASEYISHDKSLRLIRAAAAWCQANRHSGSYQIDVFTVEGALEHPTLEHLQDVLSA